MENDETLAQKMRPMTRRYVEESLQASATRFVRNTKGMISNGGLDDHKKCRIVDEYCQLKMIAQDLGLDMDRYVILADPQFWEKLSSILGVLSE